MNSLNNPDEEERERRHEEDEEPKRKHAQEVRNKTGSSESGRPFFKIKGEVATTASDTTSCNYRTRR